MQQKLQQMVGIVAVFVLVLIPMWMNVNADQVQQQQQQPQSQQQQQQQQHHHRHNRHHQRNRTPREHGGIGVGAGAGVGNKTRNHNHRHNAHDNYAAATNKSLKLTLIATAAARGTPPNWWPQTTVTASGSGSRTNSGNHNPIARAPGSPVKHHVRPLFRDPLGINVCPQYKTIKIPVKTREVYTKQIYKTFTEPCHTKNICTSVRLVNEPAYRDVIRHRISKRVDYNCCTGWEQATKASNDCVKPICQQSCKNNGTCARPDVCSCPKGFTGATCELDENECHSKPCDQICYNTEGSYYCTCRHGFMLAIDRQSCRKIEFDDEDALEAKDLEAPNDRQEYDELSLRLEKLERAINANSLINAGDMGKKLAKQADKVDYLQNRVESVENRQLEFNFIRDKIKSYETEVKRIEHLVDMLYRCRYKTGGGYCP